MAAIRPFSAVLLPVALLALTACADHGRGTLGSLTPLASIGFDSRLIVPTGPAATGCVLVADVDRDGRSDIVAAGLDGTLFVRLGQGAGVFATATTLALPARPVAVRQADLDFDGDLDLVALVADGRVQVFLGDGSGDFTPGVPFAVGSNPLDLALGDVDGDGAADIVVTEHGVSDICLFRGLGDGTFVGRISLHPTRRGATVGYQRIGDFDGDGRPDLALADFELGRVIVLLGDAGGLPTVDVSVDVGVGPFGLAVGDLDGDGVDEIAVSLYFDHAVKVLGLRAPFTLGVEQVLIVDGNPGGLHLADLDGDGRLDLAVSILDRHAVDVFSNQGGTFAFTPIEMPLGGSALTPIVADLDDDGRVDLIVPSYGADGVNLFRGKAGGLRGGRFHRVPGIPAPSLVHSGDFDGDGRSEVVVAGFSGSVVTLATARTLGDGEVYLEELAAIDLGRDVQNVHAQDLDGDGLVDLVVPVAGGIKLLANRSSGGRLALEAIPPAPAEVLAPGRGPFEIVVGDVDGDRLRDIVVADHVDGLVRVLRGTNQRFVFLDPVDTPLAGRPFGLAIGDFDGDGILEVATSRLTQGTVTILEMSPSGLVASVDIPVGPGPNYLRTADFNADGRHDLVVSDGAGSSISVLLSLGGNAFNITSIGTGEWPTALLATDLNGDGFDDILVASLRGADCRVVLGDGRGGFAAPIAFPGINEAIAATLADLDGDGLRDLILGSFESRAIATFMNVSRRN